MTTNGNCKAVDEGKMAEDEGVCAPDLSTENASEKDNDKPVPKKVMTMYTSFFMS